MQTPNLAALVEILDLLWIDYVASAVLRQPVRAEGFVAVEWACKYCLTGQFLPDISCGRGQAEWRVAHTDGRDHKDMVFWIEVSVSAIDSALHSFCASQFHEKRGVGGGVFL